MRRHVPQAVEIIRSLIDRIEVHPRKERGHCEVIIVGALAQSSLLPTKDGGTSFMACVLFAQ